MNILSLEHFYWVAGAMLLVAALRIGRQRGHPHRFVTAAFWGLFGAIFVGGKIVPAGVVGYAIIGLVLLAASGRVVGAHGHAENLEERHAEAVRLRNRIFGPALLIPFCAVLVPWGFSYVHGARWALLEARQGALIAVSFGAVLALGAACYLGRSKASEPLREGTRLLQAVSWALVLPQLLAALGGIFSAAGVGTEIARIFSAALPHPGPFLSVAAYCTGMTLFTMCLGNAFAAFAVITAGIGLPFIVILHGGNPAIMGAIGMLTGYCGTLLTPMAANFNLVPALLLELPDRYAVIRAQVPLAATIFIANIFLMWITVYRF